jgi:hypothetical protein
MWWVVGASGAPARQSGAAGETDLAQMSVRERMVLFTEGPRGPEPLWLRLTENGLPFRVDSWEGVFREANDRCARVLTPIRGRDWDPHRVYSPYATPHSARHSFALYMLIVLNTLMDVKYGVTEDERRDFRLAPGTDPLIVLANKRQRPQANRTGSAPATSRPSCPTKKVRIAHRTGERSLGSVGVAVAGVADGRRTL